MAFSSQNHEPIYYNAFPVFGLLKEMPDIGPRLLCKTHENFIGPHCLSRQALVDFFLDVVFCSIEIPRLARPFVPSPPCRLSGIPAL